MNDSERRTLGFIEIFIAEHGYSPKLNEIAEGIGIKSKGTVSRYVNNLIEANLLTKIPGKQRGLALVEHLSAKAMPPLPLVGMIAAGQPIEAIAEHEVLDLASLLEGQELFVLKVRGQSMIDDGILDGDFVICKRQETANNGETVVALIDGEHATLKRLYSKTNNRIFLVPANTTMSPMEYDASRVLIQGVLKGVFRKSQ